MIKKINLTIGVIVIAALAMLGSGKAKAEPDMELTYAQKAMVRTYGQVYCKWFAENPTKIGVVYITKDIMDDGFSLEEAAEIESTSFATYCPMANGVINSWANSNEGTSLA
jgi:hypothetical protein